MSTPIPRKGDRAVTYLLLLTITLLLQFLSGAGNAENMDGFDHFSTGFPLVGRHEFVECSACHIAGQFKGTPLECGQCHNNIRVIGKHRQHVPSNDFCDDCHTENTWLGARFDHSGVTGTCDSCHNNQIAIGKSATHILSAQICDDCHNTINFTRVGVVDHSSVIGTCKSCHNGFIAIGMTPNHPVTQDECNACHTTITFKGATL